MACQPVLQVHKAARPPGRSPPRLASCLPSGSCCSGLGHTTGRLFVLGVPEELKARTSLTNQETAANSRYGITSGRRLERRHLKPPLLFQRRIGRPERQRSGYQDSAPPAPWPVRPVFQVSGRSGRQSPTPPRQCVLFPFEIRAGAVIRRRRQGCPLLPICFVGSVSVQEGICRGPPDVCSSRLVRK